MIDKIKKIVSSIFHSTQTNDIEEGIEIFLKYHNVSFYEITEKDFFENYFVDTESFDFLKSLEENKAYLTHETSEDSLKGIIETKEIFGSDIHNLTTPSHFHKVGSSNNSAFKKGVTMFFLWKGKQMYVGSREDDFDPKILYHISSSDKINIKYMQHYKYWESRIYPGSKELYLIGFNIGSKYYYLEENINIKTIQDPH